MTQSSMTENGIGELKDFITTQFNQLDKKFDARFNELDKKLEVYIAKTDEKLENIKNVVSEIKERVSKLEDTKEKQIWTLITLLGGSLITVALRFFFTSNNL